MSVHLCLPGFGYGKYYTIQKGKSLVSAFPKLPKEISLKFQLGTDDFPVMSGANPLYTHL